MTCCTMFASWSASSLTRSLASADPDLSGSIDSSKTYDPLRLAKLEDTLKRYEDHFSRHLRILMDRYGYTISTATFDASANLETSLNYFAATESVVLLKLAHSLSAIGNEE